ncbi:MAG: segregation/condensation protein A [Verrucomicrobiota bacterium]|nr:segregation/condensation protein A [Verrucomicrobiota bacterium]
MAQVQDNLIQNNEHPIRLPVFEGPLDLLLFLIRKNEIDIYDIPIEKVTDQYLDILHNSEHLNLEAAGEFFVMAATLMQIKSRMLLPKEQQRAETENDEEGSDPRWELVRQLIEYKKFKDAAQHLNELIRQAQDMLPRYFPSHGGVPLGERTLQPTNKIETWNLFNQVLRRLAEKLTVGQIHGETVTVSDRMEYVLEVLNTRPIFTFASIFDAEEKVPLYVVIATFLAVLELTRMRRIRIEQDTIFGDILCVGRDDYLIPEVDTPPPNEPVEPVSETVQNSDDEEAEDDDEQGTLDL